jgi:hypothetical protein
MGSLNKVDIASYLCLCFTIFLSLLQLVLSKPKDEIFIAIIVINSIFPVIWLAVAFTHFITWLRKYYPETYMALICSKSEVKRDKIREESAKMEEEQVQQDKLDNMIEYIN